MTITEAQLDDTGEYQSGPAAGSAVIPSVTHGEREVQYADVDGLAVFEGDIVLGTVEEFQAQVGTEGIGITGDQLRWPTATVPFEVDSTLPNQQRITDAVAHWAANTRIRFIPRTAAHADYVRFRPSTASRSPVGRRGGRQDIELTDGAPTGTVIHEMGHALGLWHEQSREDRNTLIEVRFANIAAANQHNFNQHITDGDDIGNYDFGSIMHYPATAFSTNGQPTIVPRVALPPGVVMGQRNGLSGGDIDAVHAMYPELSGIYTIRQKSTGRFLDAHESSANDFRLVTRTAQNNDTQRWLLTPIGAVYTIRQGSNGRFIDAHENSANDFGLVTRSAQNNDTQRWVLIPNAQGQGDHTLQQLSTRRFVDAHEDSANDFSVVTRPAQNNDSQRWVLADKGDSTFTLQQKNTGRFVDAHENSANDFRLVTRPAQSNDTQRWIFGFVGTVYTAQQRSNNRFVDAHEDSGNDFSVVTRPAQNNDSQRWVALSSVDGSFTLQQLSTGRFVDAHEDSANDFSVVTRPAQNNDSQRWIIDRA